jgi:mono/diheme cytochrome c family protein
LLLLSLLIACGGSEPEPAHEEVHADAAKTEEPARPADPHAAHGGHMAQMAATREKLRAELGEAYDQPVGAGDPVAGKAIYEQHCQSCHGPGGKGDGPAAAGLNPTPGDLTDSFHARYYSDAGRVHIIKKGSEGTAMAAFEGTLTEQQILDVYAYIVPMRGETPAAAPAPAEHDHGSHDHGDGKGAHSH